MHNFDSLKDLWQQTPVAGTGMVPPMLSTNAANAKLKLQREQAGGAIMLTLTAILITGMALFGNFKFEHAYTYVAMGLLALICLLQAVLFLFTYRKLVSINETSPPALHLQQWEAYYTFRQKQVRWNMPVYFIALNLSMLLYLFEVLSGRPIVGVIIFFSLYIGWMLFAIFYLGKKNLRKEKQRLHLIIEELKVVAQQFGTAG